MFDFEDNSNGLGDDMFDVEYCHVDDVVNKVVVYKGMTDKETANGLKKLIAVTLDDGTTESAFITSSKKVVDQIASIDQSHFPFRAIMKCVSYGGAMTGFKLFSPNSEVTSEDQRLFNLYKKSKFKR